jgi:hypothetical protein
VLTEAVGDAEKNHIERSYHFPCIVVHYQEPPQFSIGPVIFTAASAVPDVFRANIQEYIDGSQDQGYASERVRKFQEFISTAGWLASVTIPPCAEESAQRRAEVSITTALNLLRLLFGVPYGRDMRLAHTAQSKPRQTEYAISRNGKLNFVWSRRGEGALVEKDWYLQMGKFSDFLDQAGHLLSTTVQGRRSEIAERVVDALTWFGEAAFETAPGTQIVNFVAALERLTTTEWFKTSNFCTRVTILASDDESQVEKSYWDAYTIHNARSSVIHGGFSPTSPIFLKTVRLAHDVTRAALFRGLEVHRYLETPGKLSDLADLQNFFNSQQSKKAVLLKRLRQELKQKEEAARQK